MLSKPANFLLKTEEPENDEKSSSPSSADTFSACTTSSRLQPIKPGDNVQPKYLSAQFDWSTLNELQSKSTVFDDCRNRMESLVEAISQQEEVSSKMSLSEEQRQRIDDLRSRMSVQLFEIMFAIHRMDTKVVDAAIIEQLIRIAPARCDAHVLSKIIPVNDANEEFLQALIKIENLEEKLATMRHINNFSSDSEQIKNRINRFESIAKDLMESNLLKTLIQAILACANLIFEAISTQRHPQQLSDCELQSVSIESETNPEQSQPLLHRNERVGTDKIMVDKAVGPSKLHCNAATSYEFQVLNATQIHRALNDPKLHKFINKVYPMLKEELDDSELFNNL